MVAPDDDAHYFYIARRIAAGDLPYRDVWDQKLPLQYFWTFLFGTSPIGSLPLLRAATLLIFTYVPYFAFLAIREFTGSRRAALLSAITLILWFVPSREMNAVFLEVGFGVAALLLLTKLIVSKKEANFGPVAAGFFAVGCFLGLSLAIRPLTAPIIGFLTICLLMLAFGFCSALLRILLDMWRMVWEFNLLYVGQRNVFRNLQSIEQFVREIYDIRLYQLTFLGFSSVGGFAFSFLKLWRMIKNGEDHRSYRVLLAISTMWFATGGFLIALPGGGGHLQYWMLCHVGLLVCSCWLITELFTHNGLSGETKAVIVGSVMFLLLIPNLAYVGSVFREPDYNLPPGGFAWLSSEARQSSDPLPVLLWGSNPRLLVDLNLREVTAPPSLFLLRNRIIDGPRGDAFYEEAWQRALADVERTPPLFILVTGDPAFLKEISAFDRRIGPRLVDFDLVDTRGQSKVYRRSNRYPRVE
jgi:hypothetical protein